MYLESIQILINFFKYSFLNFHEFHKLFDIILIILIWPKNKNKFIIWEAYFYKTFNIIIFYFLIMNLLFNGILKKINFYQDKKNKYFFIIFIRIYFF
jgi:hypothetical protein